MSYKIERLGGRIEESIPTVEAESILSQIIGQMFAVDIKYKLNASDRPTDEQTVEYVKKNLWDEMQSDEEFYEILYRSIFWLADRFGAKKND